MPKGYREINPFINSWAGDRPNSKEIFLYKTLTTAGVVYLYNKIPNDSDDNKKIKKSLLWILNSFQFSVDLRNEKVTGGILLKKTF